MSRFNRLLGFAAALTTAFALAACQDNVQTREDAVKALDRTLADVDRKDDIVTRGSASVIGTANEGPSLPPIDTFEMVVDPRRGAGVTVVEIFTSPEKAGKGTDAWMIEVAEDFNRQKHQLPGGSVAQIAVRKMSSGTGHDYIAFDRYIPDAFSPSSAVWAVMAEARGIEMTEITDRLVGNIAGIVMKEPVAKRIESEAGTIDVAKLIDLTVQGQVIAGYTDPFTSSTGLNFLVSVLNRFAEGDEARMLSPDVASTFEAFQKNVPFVAINTLQMRDSVANDGSLDFFVMEWQTYANTRSLQSGYRFIPFGVRHDNPLYAVGNLPAAKTEALNAFAAFATSAGAQAKATRYGFNPEIAHEAPLTLPAGDTLIAAQALWKQKKDGGRKIAAIFLADISGSMDGTRLRELKKALKEGAAKIAPENAIGLVAFSSGVSQRVAVGDFNALQRSRFISAVDQLQAGGGTAMYDGIAVSLKLLLEELTKDPEVKPLLFVLTDGATNEGHGLSHMRGIIKHLNIPVHTIGFEANLADLGDVSSLVEAASINASEDDVSYKIGVMLNSQM